MSAMCLKRPSVKSQYGFLLVTAIFLLVVLAALGAFILTISGTQQTGSALDVQGARAYQAARAGIDWASYQLLIGAGGGAVAFDAASQNSGTGTTVNVTHTVSGSNRLMLVGISTLVDEVVNSVVWDPAGVNQSLSLVTGCNRLSANGEMWIYQLVAPATGTLTLTVTFATSASAAAGVTSFTGVDQTTPLGTCVVANGDPGPATVTVTSAPGELVFDTVASDENVTANASQNVRWDITTPVHGGGSTKAGASSVTMSWTAGSTGWAIGGVSIKPVTVSAFAIACNPGPTTQNVTGMGGTLSGFTAAVQCSSTTYTEGGATVTVYQITSTGSQGTVGTLDRVERQLQVTLNK